MGSSPRLARQKISTTISPEALAYLERLIKKRESHTLAEAIDLVVARLRTYENRERLEADTAAYFERMSHQAAEEESRLGTALSHSARGIDFDREP